MPTMTMTIRITKGAPREDELAALIVALRVLRLLDQPPTHWGTTSGLAAQQTVPRRPPWIRPRRCSGPPWMAARTVWPSN